jgi:hypothetical protein
LDRLGVKLSLRLVVDAPAGVMTEEVMAALAAHKLRLLAMLGGESPAPWPPRPAELASWPIAWREKWGRLANALQDQGVPWPGARATGVRSHQGRAGGIPDAGVINPI